MRNAKGMTLIELTTVMAIIGILIGVFYSVFILNWQSIEGNIAEADLGGELQSIVDPLTNDGRFAKRMDVVLQDDKKQVILTDLRSNVLGIYTMNYDGQFTVDRPGTVTDVKTTRLDFTKSTFVKNGNSLEMKITLTDHVSGHPVQIQSASEIYLRN